MYSFSETNKIISEIKKRPALYNKNHADYNNKEVREQIWTEICWELFPNWSDLDEYERLTRLKDIQKKWRNVRDSFRKEVKYQKQQGHGGIKKKRQYVYYKQLKFMIPFYLDQEQSEKNVTQDQSNVSSPEPTEEECEEDETEDNSEIIKLKFENDDTNDSSSSYDSKVEVEENEKPVLEMWDNNTENGYYNTESGHNNDSNYSLQNDDEDRFFLLSLIPSFKVLSRQQKLTAKVEFLQVLQRITSDNNK